MGRFERLKKIIFFIHFITWMGVAWLTVSIFLVSVLCLVSSDVNLTYVTAVVLMTPVAIFFLAYDLSKIKRLKLIKYICYAFLVPVTIMIVLNYGKSNSLEYYASLLSIFSAWCVIKTAEAFKFLSEAWGETP